MPSILCQIITPMPSKMHDLCSCSLIFTSLVTFWQLHAYVVLLRHIVHYYYIAGSQKIAVSKKKIS